MAFVAVTRLRVRSWRYLPAFLGYVFLISRQAKSAPGNLGSSLLNDARFVFWTRSAWTDEAAMRAFMVSGVHRRVMPHLLNWCDEASLVHWEQYGAELPIWSVAHRRMLEEGRRSRVRYPSEAQERFKYPAPR